jgi:hypothetical protein
LFPSHLAREAFRARDNRKRRVSPFLRLMLPILGLFLSFSACSSTTGTDADELREVPVVQLAPHEETIALGDSLMLHLLPMLPPGYVPAVSWSSSNPEVAPVEPIGPTMAKVLGLSPGQSMIHVFGDGARDSTTVIIVPGGGG